MQSRSSEAIGAYIALVENVELAENAEAWQDLAVRINQAIHELRKLEDYLVLRLEQGKVSEEVFNTMRWFIDEIVEALLNALSECEKMLEAMGIKVPSAALAPSYNAEIEVSTFTVKQGKITYAQVRVANTGKQRGNIYLYAEAVEGLCGFFVRKKVEAQLNQLRDHPALRQRIAGVHDAYHANVIGGQMLFELVETPANYFLEEELIE